MPVSVQTQDLPLLWDTLTQCTIIIRMSASDTSFWYLSVKMFLFQETESWLEKIDRFMS